MKRLMISSVAALGLALGLHAGTALAQSNMASGLVVDRINANPNNPAFDMDLSPNECTGNCTSNGVVQFGGSGALAVTNSVAGQHANPNSKITNPPGNGFGDPFEMQINPQERP